MLFEIVFVVVLIKIGLSDGLVAALKSLLIGVVLLLVLQMFVGSLLAWLIVDIAMLVQAFLSGAISRL